MNTTYIMVGLGGAAGAMLRFGLSQWATRWAGHGFPYGTLGVNLIGSFCIGVAIVALGHWGAHRLAPLMVTGLLGGFTTFSAFSLDLVTLVERDQTGLAAVYATGSVLGGLGLAFGGMAVTRAVLT